MPSKDVREFNLAVGVAHEGLRQAGHQSGSQDHRDIHRYDELRRVAAAAVMPIIDPQRHLKRAENRRELERDITEILKMGAAALGYDLVKKDNK